MKKSLYFTILFISFFGFSQNSPCGTDVIMQNIINSNPSIQYQMNDINNIIAKKKALNANKQSYSLLPETITIPVVVYVVHNGTASSNITDLQVQQQLSALNNRFYNTGIKFCLATRAGAGAYIPTISNTQIQDTPGIIHVNNAILSNTTWDTAGQTALNSIVHSSITNDKYLKIWVVNSINGASTIQGFATLPSTYPTFDGIVIRTSIFGSIEYGTSFSSLDSGYQQGEVLVHEVGHYLGLDHTFKGGCETPNNDDLLDGDNVSDTPRVAAANFNCTFNTNSCVESPPVYDLINNYLIVRNYP